MILILKKERLPLGNVLVDQGYERPNQGAPLPWHDRKPLMVKPNRMALTKEQMSSKNRDV